ncbi:hypothetical protein JCM11491_002913 [Sporobolomyces phaffii]
MHGYTMLFDRGANKYGRYLDLFDPASLDCHASEELYDPAYYRKLGEEGLAANVGSVINDQFERPSLNRLLVGTDDIHPLNHHITALVYPDMSYLDSLPDLDASKPVPVASSVPRVFAESFDRYSALSVEYFQFNGLLKAKVNGELARLGLDNRTREAPTIGVHWRGGDKLERECVGSSQLSCGNVTHHCVTAWDSLSSTAISTSSTLSKAKPRLLLMTTEPNALELFRNDAICRRFEVQLLEESQEKQSFVQDQWNALSDAERAADVQSMFVGSEILANHVDAAVASPNSNLVRLIMARAGPRRVTEQGAIRSVDIYWHHRDTFRRLQGGGAHFPYPKEVWSPAGGWWTRPANWKSSTGFVFLGIGLATYGIWSYSAQKEWRHTEPTRPIPSQMWAKQFKTGELGVKDESQYKGEPVAHH